MNTTVDTRICEVTVYENQALVTRRGVVQLTGEEDELVIAPLPATLVSESVQVRSTGRQAVRLLGVQIERTHAGEAIAQKSAQINQEIGQIEEQKRHGQDLLTLLNLQRNFVKNLSTQYMERLTRIPNSEPMNLEQIKELLDFVEHQYSQLSDAIATSEKEQKQLEKQLQPLRQQLQQFATPNAQESFSIIITLEPSAVGEVELEVSYFVHQASWVPLYDLRLEQASEKINLSYLAQVKQSSGENWQGVALTLSTAKPGMGTLPPKLSPWYIDVQHLSDTGQEAKTIAEFERMQSRALTATMPFPGMTPAPEMVKDADLERLKAQMAMTEISKQGGIVTLRASRSSDIKSDGATHTTTIFNRDYPCRAKYIALPRLVNLAYLQTTIANPLGEITLLAGKASIFRDNTFIGTTQLENIAPGQEFKLNWGIDEGLKIHRVLVERQVDKPLSDNQQHAIYAYQMVIKNLRDRTAELTLTEQLPVSRNEQIKVRLTDSNPQIEMGEMGMLEWSLTLPPHSSQELYYQFAIEHPSELAIVGLDI
jgi:uncharacterized protein (TIGR02231 family)